MIRDFNSKGLARVPALSALFAILLALCTACSEEPTGPPLSQTLQELALDNARRCEGVYTWPQDLIDGLSYQLISELQCMQSDLLVWYEPCKAVGCVWAYGPQPLAMRPEVLAALEQTAASLNDYITISAAYRDVAMQYFSRWYKENCNSSFNAAVPGTSNHQGGRAIDVRSYSYWWDALLEHGFDHPIPSDKPHFELRGDAQFRAQSEELKVLSVLAFQRLWNRNHPDDLLVEDGLYGPATKARLGASPVAGFAVSGCDDGGGDDGGGDDGGGDDGGGEDEPDCRALIRACADEWPCALLEGTGCVMPNPDPCRGDFCEECPPGNEECEELPPLTGDPGSEDDEEDYVYATLTGGGGCAMSAGDVQHLGFTIASVLLGLFIVVFGAHQMAENDSRPPLRVLWDWLMRYLDRWIVGTTPAPELSEEALEALKGVPDEVPPGPRYPHEILEAACGPAPLLAGAGLPAPLDDSLEAEFQEALRRVELRDRAGTGPDGTDVFAPLSASSVEGGGEGSSAEAESHAPLADASAASALSEPSVAAEVLAPAAT